GSAQFKAIRKIAGRLRLDLAQYREMAAFAQFGSDLDKATQDKLAQGERLMEVLKQTQFSPLSMAEQAAALFVSVNGYLLDIKKENVNKFIRDFLEYLRSHYTAVLNTITRTQVTGEETESALRKAVEDFKQLKIK
ncbi:MAG: F0F1 ATP synthase subunit alpha, partial [Treponema sp.]|nr:F0F1 ATP synthase subunit alpha [Treponema sp.]